MNTIIQNLEKLLESQGESVLLRFSLGNAWLANDPTTAASHFERAVVLDPEYSAAWKLLGRAWNEAGNSKKARDAFAKGIAAASARGDVQARKEMEVFLRRAEKQLNGVSTGTTQP